MSLAIEANPLISTVVNERVQTSADNESPVSREDGRRVAMRDSWGKVIDKLLRWLLDTSELEDEGVEAPSIETVRNSLILAEHSRAMDFPSPDSVVPDANGGIVFERRECDVREVFHVWDDGSVEYRRFCSSHLEERWLL